MEKMTYIVALNSAIACEALSAEVREKLTALRDQTEKRNSSDRKPTKTQVENEGLKALILGCLTSEGQTVTEIMGRSLELSALSNQKVSALVNALVKEGKALKIPDGRKTTFALMR